MITKKIILIAVVVVVVVGTGIWLFAGSPAKHKVTYATATVSKGDISKSVTATGTNEPVTEEEVAVTPEPTATPKPTSTPKPTPTPDAYPASAITASLVSESSVDISSIHEAYIESASATSEIKQASGVSNDP